MKKKILITCGPTWVALDSVRVLSNISSGKLGQALAQELSKKGAQVTLLEGAVETPLTGKKIRILKFKTFDELFKILKTELKKPWDVVIHAAAVSDYRPKTVAGTKLSSSQKLLKLELVPTPKVINTVKKINQHVFLVGFKLDPKLSQTNAASKTRYLYKNADCDLVVANRIHGTKYQAYLVTPTGKILGQAANRSQLVKTLIKNLEGN